MRLLALDPGFQTGWAFFNNKAEKWRLCYAGIMRAKGEDWLRVGSLVKVLGMLVNIHDPELVVIEMPQYFDNAGGNMAAKRGDLGKLMIVTGALFGAAASHGVDVQLVPVRTWKGNLPKSVSQERTLKALAQMESNAHPSSHALDAAGLGLWVIEKLRESR